MAKKRKTKPNPTKEALNELARAVIDLTKRVQELEQRPAYYPPQRRLGTPTFPNPYEPEWLPPPYSRIWCVARN